MDAHGTKNKNGARTPLRKFIPYKIHVKLRMNVLAAIIKRETEREKSGNRARTLPCHDNNSKHTKGGRYGSHVRHNIGQIIYLVQKRTNSETVFLFVGRQVCTQRTNGLWARQKDSSARADCTRPSLVSVTKKKDYHS